VRKEALLKLNKISNIFSLVENLPSLPSNVRIIIVPSTNSYHLPIKSHIHIDEKTNTIQLEPSNKLSSLATGHFALEFDEHQPPFIFLLNYAQEISRLTDINTFISNTKTFNYLSAILPKTKSFNQYHWYISHDQQAISIRQIPFTSIKQLINILNLIRQQIYLTKYLNYYFNNNYDHDQMEEDNLQEISLELSFLSSTILSITCAQSYYLSTFLLQMSNIHILPVLIHRQEHKEFSLTNEKNSLLKLIEKLLKENHTNEYLSLNNDLKSTNQSEEILNIHPPKFNRRLSCGPPAKPTWRRATTLRRNQPACLTLNNSQEIIPNEQLIDDDINQNLPTEDFHDEDDTFIQSPQQQQQQQLSYHPQLLPRPSLSFHPSTLSRCTSVSSTQSVSTPPIFGLSPSTPYPGGINNPNTNIFFPLGKQVSVPDYDLVTSPITMGTFDPLVFLPTNPLTSSTMDTNNKIPQKKKRRRSEHSADEFMQTLNNGKIGSGCFANLDLYVYLDNRSSIHATKLSSSGGDPSNAKRGKKPMDKNPQQQLIRQKSAFKVTDSPTASLLSQQSVTSPDDTSNELKPLKVVIKRVEGSGNSSNDESQQQQSIKQRKKQLMGNTSGSLPTAMRKLPNNNSSGGSSPSVLIKTESLDMSQLGSDANTMMTINDGMQQISR
jgi:hypothetical protein